jgi:hypothetical protein
VKINVTWKVHIYPYQKLILACNNCTLGVEKEKTYQKLIFACNNCTLGVERKKPTTTM